MQLDTSPSQPWVDVSAAWSASFPASSAEGRSWREAAAGSLRGCSASLRCYDMLPHEAARGLPQRYKYRTSLRAAEQQALSNRTATYVKRALP
eukprot:6178367-Pleurochrysis_carterae.AAC.2